MVIAGIEFKTEPRWVESIQVWSEVVTPTETDCPRCGRMAKVSLSYYFDKDSVAFYCPHCGVFEWQGHKI